MKEPVKILVVDDDEDDFLIIKEYINTIKEYNFIIDWCYSYPKATSKICDGEYNLYFIDYLLGAKTGLELIKESILNGCEEPFILLTGNGNRIIDMKAMESGAVDYLVKTELNTEKLERCIRYSLERSSSLKALRNNERKFRNIFERSKDTVFIADENLVFSEINNGCFSLLEYEKEALLSMNLYSFITKKEDAADIKQLLNSKGIVSDKEIELTTKSGESKSCIITLSKETDIKRNVYIQGIIHEITALKKAEKATLMLEKMNMASRLVRTMAHEIRNPLNNILLSAENLAVLFKNDETANYLDIIKRNGMRINSLITELMRSSRPGEIFVQKRSLQSILDECIESAMDRMNLQNIQLQRNYIEDTAWIMADCEKLKIAFLNIIINAIEAMQKGEGKLLISIKKNNDVQYVVTIQDNGCGISRENVVKLFEPYFTTKKNGVGLGLASVLNILQSHNASIDVDSDIQRGTVFKLFFMRAESALNERGELFVK